MAHMKAVRLLAALELMPLEEISEYAEAWRMDIRDAIQELGTIGLPADDPLRYSRSGDLLSEQELEQKLQIIIDSWPIFGLGEEALWPDKN